MIKVTSWTGGRDRVAIRHLLEGKRNDKRLCLDKACRLRFEPGTINELSSSNLMFF